MKRPTPTSWTLRIPNAAVLGAALLLMLAAAPVPAGIVGQWDFTNGLNASVGLSLDYFDGPGGPTETATQFGTTASLGISNLVGQAANVMRAPKTTSTMGYGVNLNATGNGGGSLLNQYSLVFDAYFPVASSGKNRCLIQIDDPWANSNEGEFYVAANNGLGTVAKPHGVVSPDAWHRLVITVDLAAVPPVATKYIDGAKVGQETLADVVDGRWALGVSRALLFTDNTSSFEVTYLNSIQILDTVLSPGYVAALGKPSGDAIPASVVPIAVVNRVQPAANDAFVLPGTAIEADLLPAGQPIPTDSVKLLLDGVAVSATITSPSAGLMRVSYNPGLLAPESPHTVRVSFVDPVVGTNSQQMDWSFRMCPYQMPPPDASYEGLLSLGLEEPTAVDGGTVADSSAAHNSGVVRLQAGVGDLKGVGAVGKGLDFTVNQTTPQNYVELAHGYGTAPNSFAAWVKVDSNFPTATRVGVILGNYPVTNAINWEIHTAGRPRVYWGYASGGLVDWIVNDDLRSGQWEHVAFVRDAVRGFSYYRNGRLAAVLTNAGPTVAPVESPFVGSDRRTASFQAFQGMMDELTVFGRPLNSNEVFRLYTAPTAFPKFLFASPPITQLRPVDGATEVAAQPRLQVLVDESFSSNTVNLASVQLSVNGTIVTPQAVRSNQSVWISHAVASPLSPLTTNVVRVRYLDNAASPHETIRQWSFITAPAPVITWISQGATVAVGDEVTFGVRAAGSAPIAYQWRLNGAAVSGATNSSLALPAVTSAQAGTYDVVVSNPSGSTASKAVPLVVVSSLPLAGLLNDVTGYYPFESQVNGVVSNAVRTVGYPGFDYDEAYLNGFEGPPTAAVPPYTTDSTKVRAGTGALDCDGVGDYGTITGNPVQIDLDWSVAAWFRPDTGRAGYLGSTRAFIFETGSVYPISFGLRAGTTGNSNFQLYSDYASGTDPYRDYQVPNAGVDRWHHIVVIYRSASAVIEGYLDGALTHQISLTAALNTGVSGFRIGTYRSADTRYFKGQIDEVAMWQRSLTATEVSDLFATGQLGQSLATRIGQSGGTAFKTGLNGYYSFDNRTDWVVPNSAAAVGGTGSFSDDALTMKGGTIDPSARVYPITQSAALARVGQGALSGDGTNDYAHINGNPVDPNQDWSVAAWFKPDTSGLGISGTTRGCVFETAPANYTISYDIKAAFDPNYTAFTLYSQASVVAQTNLVLNSDVDRWHYIVQTYDAAAGLLKGYLDGNQAYSVTQPPGTVMPGYNGFNIGTYRAADGRFFKGLIDEVTFWQRKLNPAAVSQAYALGSAGVAWFTSVPKVLAFMPNSSPAGSYTLTWQATAGFNYSVQASADLLDWSSTVVANVTAAGGTVSIIISPTQPAPANGYYDAGLSGASKRFYRVRWNP